MTDGQFQCELTLPAAIRLEERTAYGYGSSKKEAKTCAARKMWESLTKRSPWPRWEGPDAPMSRAKEVGSIATVHLAGACQSRGGRLWRNR